MIRARLRDRATRRVLILLLSLLPVCLALLLESCASTNAPAAGAGDAAFTEEAAAADSSAPDASAPDALGVDALADGGTVSVYPPLPGDLYRSGRYAVGVGPAGAARQDSYVYTSVNNGSQADGGLMSIANHWTSFDFTGSVDVHVVALKQTSLTGPVIRPLAKGITASAAGNVVTFTISAPGQYYVDLSPEHLDPLFIFANAPEPPPPACGGPVVCFGPGVTAAGTITVKSGQTVYLAPGAYVKGRVVTDGSGSVTVRGHGILSGIDYAITSEAWTNPQMIDGWSLQTGVMSVVVDGITITDAPGPLINSGAGKANISNVKLMGWHFCTDGVSYGASSTVSDSFFKVLDDNVHMDRENVVAKNLVVWLQVGGSILQMGWNLTSNVTKGWVTDVDVIGADRGAWKGSVDGGLYNNSLVTAENFKGRNDAGVTYGGTGVDGGGVLIENVRVEPTMLQIFALETKGTMVGYTEGLGTISGVTFKNITVAKAPLVKNVFDGNGTSTGQVKDLTFDGVTIAGAKLQQANEPTFSIRRGQTSNFVYK
jgi:hypothetical protein